MLRYIVRLTGLGLSPFLNEQVADISLPTDYYVAHLLLLPNDPGPRQWYSLNSKDKAEQFGEGLLLYPMQVLGQLCTMAFQKPELYPRRHPRL